MEDKIFDLLEKVYIELQQTKKELKGELSGVKDDLSGLKDDLSGVKNRLILLENSVAAKISSLFEAQMITNEKLAGIDEKFCTLFQIVDNHEIRIQAIEDRN